MKAELVSLSPQEKVRTYMEVERLSRRYGPTTIVRAVLVLQVEAGGGGVTCGSLASLLCVTTGATTHITDAAVDLGWMERYAGPDRREVWVRLTELGVQVAQHILGNLSP